MFSQRGEGLSPRRFFAGTMALALLGTASYVRKNWLPDPESYANYRLVFSDPGEPWKPIPHSPQALFLYKHAQFGYLLRGAMNDIEEDVNPMPELDRDGLAKYMLELTSNNMKSWRGEMLDAVPAQGTSFRMIRRWNPQKCVITAIAVKGNTTILVTLSANGTKPSGMSEALPDFRSYLSHLSLRRFYYD